MDATATESAVEVLELTSDWHITLLARGHIDPAAMRAAAMEAREGDLKGFCDPIHTWWRVFPKWQEGVRAPWYQHAEPHARGAFRCTVMTKDW